MHPLRHALGAAACAALAVLGLAACDGDVDDAALRPAAGSAATTTADAAAPAPTAAAPTSTEPAPPTTAPSTPSRSAPRPTTPPTTPAPPPAPPSPTPRPTEEASETAPAATDTSVAGQVLALVNAERERAGCDPVALDDRLTSAAAGHSQDMAEDDFFSHDSRDGRGFADRITAAGYPAPRSENIAAGQPTPAAVMDSWMDSPGHRANILDCTATRMGVAAATGGDLGTYWTQDFGTT